MFQTFSTHLPLSGSDQSLDFSESSTEVHLTAYTEGTEKNEKGSLKVPKKVIPFYIQGIAPHF